MKRVLFVTFCCLSLFSLHAQSLTGVWRGYFYSGLGIFRQDFKYEVQINNLKNNALRGVTYSYESKNVPFFGKARLKGIFQVANKSVVIKEDTTLISRVVNGNICPMTCYLDYSKVGNIEVLQGTFTSIVEGTKNDCGSGTIYLEKVANSDFTKEDFLLQKPVVPPVVNRPKTTPPPLVKNMPQRNDSISTIPKKQDVLLPPVSDTIAVKAKPSLPVPPALTERKNDLIRTITTNSPDIKIDLYDNGEIDGDTITVYHNNKVVAYKKRLSAAAIPLRVTASPQEAVHEFVMYADNLGKIPPNTALMVITTGGKRYELFITSTKEKNAKVIVDYKPDAE